MFFHPMKKENPISTGQKVPLSIYETFNAHRGDTCEEYDLDLNFWTHMGFTDRLFWNMDDEVNEFPSEKNGRGYKLGKKDYTMMLPLDKKGTCFEKW